MGLQPSILTIKFYCSAASQKNQLLRHCVPAATPIDIWSNNIILDEKCNSAPDYLKDVVHMAEEDFDEAEAPPLDPRERRTVDQLARKAGTAARRKEAVRHMPFRGERDSIRQVASWMLTIKELRAFHTRWINTRGNKSYALDSIHVMKDGSYISVLNARQVQKWEDFVLAVAGAFCGYRDSDEIGELMNMSWGIELPQIYGEIDKSSGGYASRLYTYRPQRTIGRRSADPDEEDLAVLVAEALGTSESELQEAYDEAYQEAFEDEEAKIRGNKKRNERALAAQQRREERGDKGGRGKLLGGRFSRVDR